MEGRKYFHNSCPIDNLKTSMVFLSSGSQSCYFSHEPSLLFHHSVLVDLSVSMMMH